MFFTAAARVTLDFGAKATPKLLANLSGLAAAGDTLWTVSDEGRTVECLVRSGEGYVLEEQVVLDNIIPGIPGIDKTAELDLESLDLKDGTLWLAGSHCRVRKKPEAAGLINPKLRDRPSRHVLARLDLDGTGRRVVRSKAIPFEGRGSLRYVLADDPYLKHFMKLPSKENGLDIEGLVAATDGVLLGLRGPLVDNIAVVVRLRFGESLTIKGCTLAFLDLGGLAIRDLARSGPDVLVLAGPVGDAPGPFRLYSWTAADSPNVQSPKELAMWPDIREHPEGLCILERGGEPGLLVVYDRPDGRVEGSRYEADWVATKAFASV